MAGRQPDNRKSREGGKRINALLFLMLFIGAGLVAYPPLANYYNSFVQSGAVANYEKLLDNMDEESYTDIWQSALDYNQRKGEGGGIEVSSPLGKAGYNAQLNIAGNGMIGMIEIPRISLSLPIYHGTEETVLKYGVGHIDWSALPVGSAYADDDKGLENPLFGTHCLLSGHRGLPSAKLFTDLDELTVGDRFYLNILGRTLTYEVDQIHVIEPTDLSLLRMEPGRDLCTLVTCTPYGVNTHRLLVRGTRVPNEKKYDIRVTADVENIAPLIVAPILAAPILLLLLAWVLVAPLFRRRKG